MWSKLNFHILLVKVLMCTTTLKTCLKISTEGGLKSSIFHCITKGSLHIQVPKIKNKIFLSGLSIIARNSKQFKCSSIFDRYIMNMYIMLFLYNGILHNNEASRWLTEYRIACDAEDVGDMGSIPGSGRSPGGGHGNPLHYSCLENPMGTGAWWATVHKVAKSWTQLSTAHPHTIMRMDSLQHYDWFSQTLMLSENQIQNDTSNCSFTKIRNR